MSIDVYLRFAIALVLVVGLIAGLGWIARRLGWGGRFVTRTGERRLAILEVLPLDGKRRLVLLRRDTTEHLVLLGHDKDVVIESGIGSGPAKSADFAALVRGDAT